MPTWDCVEAVLEAAGHPVGRHGRTTCPIHQGDNEHAFSYTDRQWHCWACGEGGGIITLAKALGLWEEPEPPVTRPILGLPMGLGTPRSHAEGLTGGVVAPSAARRLYGALREFRGMVDTEAAVAHCEGLDRIDAARAALRSEDGVRAALEWSEGLLALEQAHSRLRTTMIECGCWNLIYRGRVGGRTLPSPTPEGGADARGLV